MAKPFAFISYRREDSALAARYLSEMIATDFGVDTVFLDVESIGSGDDWGNRIKAELARATVVIALIGPNWLRITDKYGMRRIDKPDDWVRMELAYALANPDCAVVPATLLDTLLPDAETLHESLRALCSRQVCRLRDDSWHDDLIRLMRRLETFGFVRVRQSPARYPTPQVQVREMAALELREVLERLPDWQAVPNDRRGSDLFKVFEFASFEDAMAFMQAASAFISSSQHHPTWKNQWRSVSVWLSTWDIGSRISTLDVELALQLEELRQTFAPPKPRAAATPG